MEKPYKIATSHTKKNWNFPKFVRFLGHFLKKQCFWKMGMAGIKQLPCPSKIASFSRNLNEEALLKVSFNKTENPFQSYNPQILSNAPLWQKSLKMQNFTIETQLFCNKLYLIFKFSSFVFYCKYFVRGNTIILYVCDFFLQLYNFSNYCKKNKEFCIFKNILYCIHTLST